MSLGLIGRKRGMTRVFTEEGESIPVTVIEVEPNIITQLKLQAVDDYTAVQVTVGEKKVSRLNSPTKGHFAKAGVVAGRGLWEFRITEEQIKQYEVGGRIKVSDVLEEGQRVDVRGATKGKGFSGVVKRWNFRMQDATHGNSLSHRAPGSIGQNQTPGRVFKGKKMAGQYGNKKVSVQSLLVVLVDESKNLLLVKGAVPGPAGGDLMVFPAVKRASA